MAVTFSETRMRLREDRKRLLTFAMSDPCLGGALLLNPSYQAIWLHRWSHYFFCRGQRWLARWLWHLNLWLTGADISPITQIGTGCVLHHPLSVVLVGKAGNNLTIRGHNGIGGGVGSGDVGAGPGLPVLGDNVVMDFGSVVLGPVNIGNNVRIGARCLITSDVPEGTTVEAKKPKVRLQQIEPESVSHG